MHSIWQSLAWKEWHEHKWKLASLMVIMIALLAVMIWLVDYDDDLLVLVFGVAPLAILPLTFFIGAGEAASERARGTLAFTQALPISMRKIAVQKLLFGALTCCVPVLIAFAVFCGGYLTCVLLQVGGGLRLINPFGHRHVELDLAEWLFAVSVPGLVAVASLFLWTAAIGVNRKDEVSAGAWALLAVVVWWNGLVALAHAVGPPEEFVQAVIAASPGGLAILLTSPNDDEVYWTLVVLIAVAVHLALVAIFLRRFGRVASPNRESQQVAGARSNRMNWLAPPRNSPLSAIAWKQFRESGPLALVGLAAIVVTVASNILIEWTTVNIHSAARLFVGTTSYFGLVATLVVGIGIFLTDLSPQLHTFWRSRPIDSNTWFWTKLLTGLGVLTMSFGLPVFVAGWVMLYGYRELDVAAPYFILAPLWIYSAAILMTCLVRHAVYSAILSMAVMYTSLLVCIAVSRLARLGPGWGEWSEWSEPSFAEMTSTMGVTTIACTLFAWLAVRYDWGRKSRY